MTGMYGSYNYYDINSDIFQASWLQIVSKTQIEWLS